MTRQPDQRIVTELISLLDLPRGSTIADIGAGTGNYSNAIAEVGYQVMAIKPLEMMQGQRQTSPCRSRVKSVMSVSTVKLNLTGLK